MRFPMMKAIALGVALAPLSAAQAQQYYPPGTFSVDGYPVVCGPITFVLNPTLQDVGYFRPGNVIELNPNYFVNLPTPLKLYWVAHECGHAFVGTNESAADCWAIRTGRNQGWFPPEAFNAMISMFWNNPGDMVHPSGQIRVQQMIECYRAP